MENSAERVPIENVKGIKLIYCNDLGGWLKIIPQEYAKVNAYYRKLEDEEAGREIKDDEEYRWLAEEMFRDLKLTIVEDQEYKSFGVQETCSCHGVARFVQNESDDTISNPAHKRFFEDHPFPSLNFKSLPRTPWSELAKGGLH